MRQFYFLLSCIFFSSLVNAQTVWNGPTITFTKAAGVSTTSAAGQDKITNNVWLTRDVTEGIFNIAAEPGYTQRGTSPSGTEWAYGTLSNYSTLTYKTWEAWNGKKPPGMVDKDAVLHLMADNIYIGIKFTGWGGSGTGSFSYTRTTANVLPITLNGFSASLTKQNALLKWSTSTELNNDHFEIEHSLNGKDFVATGQVKANGSSSGEHTYTYLHEHVAPGKHFYRIIDVDKGGHRSYSQTITLSSTVASALQLYPNPAASFITVTSSFLLKGLEYSVTSVSGQVLLRGKINSQQIDVQKLAAGQYWLTVRSNNGELLKAQFLKK